MVMKCALFSAAGGGNELLIQSNPAVVRMTTPTPVHLGTDEIQLIEQPTMLITIKGDIPPTLITLSLIHI